jgi:Domain of unknown function (DUF1083).
MTDRTHLEINYIAENSSSTGTNDIPVRKTWNGTTAPVQRHFESRVFWSDGHIHVRFEYTQGEPPIASSSPDVTAKTVGLWDRDVVEIFIAPDNNEPRKYFEFEAAPTGEWLDVALDLTSGVRVADWEYASGMEVAANVENGRVTIAMNIPWEAFGKKPKAGDVWLGNIFRCVGKEPDRGYLAWQPTMTEKPNFHVPEAFGEFHFL